MNTIAKVRFGSTLYGTSVPESDVDFRSIYMPSTEDCFLDRIRHAYEVKEEEDTHVFSLQHFCKMALEGQSIAIELLAAPPNMVETSSGLWETLQKNRHRFYTKNMHSFLGFAKTMAGKYSARVDRLRETEAILNVLNNADQYLDDNHERSPIEMFDLRLSAIWNHLPESLNATKGENPMNKGTDKRVYRVCGRELQATITVTHAFSVVKAIYDSYGERVRKAKDGEIEWKSMAHAFRAALQCREIVETGDLRFPLKNANWLRDLRLGKINFFDNGLDQKLDDLIAEVQTKMDASNLPEKADAKWVEELIIGQYMEDIHCEFLKVENFKLCI